jgi:hypothetical protein
MTIPFVRDPAPPPRGCLTPQVSARIAALSIGGFWLVYFLLNTLRMMLARAEDQDGLLIRRAAVTLIGAGLTGLLCLLLRRLDGRTLSILVSAAFLASIPVAIAYSAINYLAFYVVLPLDSVLHDAWDHMGKALSAPLMIAEGATEWYFFVTSWAALYLALSYAAKVRHAERSAAQYRAAAQSAQLRALRYQINPHFLFNTLNSLSTLVLRQRTDEADRMILNLSTFFRTSLTADPTADVPLAEEIRLQRLYLDIERTRFPDRLIAQFDIPAALENASVPALILQPLVENAIRHGVAQSSRPVVIAIRARQAGADLELVVEDDGGCSSGNGGHGVGLRNVCDRLAARFDGAARCVHGSRPEGGFRVILTIPLSRDD